MTVFFIADKKLYVDRCVMVSGIGDITERKEKFYISKEKDFLACFFSNIPTLETVKELRIKLLELQNKKDIDKTALIKSIEACTNTVLKKGDLRPIMALTVTKDYVIKSEYLTPFDPEVYQSEVFDKKSLGSLFPENFKNLLSPLLIYNSSCEYYKRKRIPYNEFIKIISKAYNTVSYVGDIIDLDTFEVTVND